MISSPTNHSYYPPIIRTPRIIHKIPKYIKLHFLSPNTSQIIHKITKSYPQNHSHITHHTYQNKKSTSLRSAAHIRKRNPHRIDRPHTSHRSEKNHIAEIRCRSSAALPASRPAASSSAAAWGALPPATRLLGGRCPPAAASGSAARPGSAVATPDPPASLAACSAARRRPRRLPARPPASLASLAARRRPRRPPARPLATSRPSLPPRAARPHVVGGGGGREEKRRERNGRGEGMEDWVRLRMEKG
uniref:Uncharacterized protein n=1 Tax=Oryza sativa subsp. japonica TaxID=39947 RepID=Q6K6D2_ORYSJ|nr:hypothetical protein [Oryza sativa Japonica Group]BAD23205.1 hypothetical protein [Oryza sativa Japonica Group]